MHGCLADGELWPQLMLDTIFWEFLSCLAEKKHHCTPQICNSNNRLKAVELDQQISFRLSSWHLLVLNSAMTWIISWVLEMWFHSGSLLDISLLELSVKPFCLVLSAASSHTLSSYESLASLVKSTCFSKSW